MAPSHTLSAPSHILSAPSRLPLDTLSAPSLHPISTLSHPLGTLSDPLGTLSTPPRHPLGTLSAPHRLPLVTLSAPLGTGEPPALTSKQGPPGSCDVCYLARRVHLPSKHRPRVLPNCTHRDTYCPLHIHTGPGPRAPPVYYRYTPDQDTGHRLCLGLSDLRPLMVQELGGKANVLRTM